MQRSAELEQIIHDKILIMLHRDLLYHQNTIYRGRRFLKLSDTSENLAASPSVLLSDSFPRADLLNSSFKLLTLLNISILLQSLWDLSPCAFTSCRLLHWKSSEWILHPWKQRPRDDVGVSSEFLSSLPAYLNSHPKYWGVSSSLSARDFLFCKPSEAWWLFSSTVPGKVFRGPSAGAGGGSQAAKHHQIVALGLREPVPPTAQHCPCLHKGLRPKSALKCTNNLSFKSILHKCGYFWCPNERRGFLNSLLQAKSESFTNA